MAIGHHFHFDPRVVDEWTITEFDSFAAQCDQFEQDARKQERENRHMAGRRR